jgi:uncharacterized membrane protein
VMNETMKKKKDTIIRQIMNYFLQGLLYFAPLGLTIAMIIVVFNWVDGILRPIIENFLNIHIPGLGLVIILILITFLGFIGQTVMAKPFKLIVERLIKRAPLLHMVYTSIRDFMEAFVGKEKKFNQPVLVKVNNSSNLEKLGFVTQTDLSDLKIKGKVAVYFPHSYNFSGELFIVPLENITPLDVNSGELMKFIVSGGVTKV